MKITLGPLLYYWPAERVRAFYETCGRRANVVYLGETVCSRRREMKPRDWIGLGRELAEEGVEVVLSTLTLVEARSEASSIRTLCGNGEFRVEANDYTAVAAARERGVPFVAGPTLNLYNAPALGALQRIGCYRWLPPLELSGARLRQILADAAEAMDPVPETEVFSYGRMPLAYSARCFSARHHGRVKDDCGYVCRDDPEGRPVHTRNGEPFLVINGIQTQSHERLNLVGVVGEMRAVGVTHARISPQPEGTDAVIERFRRAAADEGPEAAGSGSLRSGECDGYWHGRRGREAVVATTAEGE